MGFFQLLSGVCLLSSAFAMESFKGHRLVSVTPKDAVQMGVLDRILRSGEPYLDFWSFPSMNKTSTIRIPPKSYRLFSNQMRLAGMDIVMIDGDVESYLKRARATQVPIGPHEKASPYYTWEQGTMAHNQYYDYGEIRDHLLAMSNAFPSLVKEVGDLNGVTSENRPIAFIRIGRNENKPVIFIESLIHAREWIAGASILYTIDRLLNQSSDEGPSYVLDNFELVVVPVANPDGYQYSHTNNRLWRKNRRLVRGSCYGVDLNRNFDAFHGTSGVSTNCNSEIFCGDEAFSEAESIMIRDKVMEYGGEGGRLLAYLAVHSYSQLLLTPYSYANVKPSNWVEIETLADVMNQALMDPYNTYYQAGHGPGLLYPVSGASDDWAMLEGKALYVYTYELQPSSSNPGFEIGESYIKINGLEFWNSLIAMAYNINYE